MIHYPIPPHQQECYQEWNTMKLPVTERIHREELSLPCNQTMGVKEAEAVCQAVNEFIPSLSPSRPCCLSAHDEGLLDVGSLRRTTDKRAEVVLRVKRDALVSPCMLFTMSDLFRMMTRYSEMKQTAFSFIVWGIQTQPFSATPILPSTIPHIGAVEVLSFGDGVGILLCDGDIGQVAGEGLGLRVEAFDDVIDVVTRFGLDELAAHGLCHLGKLLEGIGVGDAPDVHIRHVVLLACVGAKLLKEFFFIHGCCYIVAPAAFMAARPPSVSKTFPPSVFTSTVADFFRSATRRR